MHSKPPRGLIGYCTICGEEQITTFNEPTAVVVHKKGSTPTDWEVKCANLDCKGVVHVSINGPTVNKSN